MNESNIKIKRYMEEISRLPPSSSSRLDLQKKCWERYHFTPSERGKLEKICSDHQVASQKDLRKGDLDGAIESMERVVELCPLNQNYSNELSHLRLIKAKESGRHGHDSVRVTAKELLKTNKNDKKAKAALRELKKEKKRGKGFQLVNLIPLVLLIAFILFGSYFGRKDYFLPYFSEEKLEESELLYEAPPQMEITPFVQREMESSFTSLDPQILIDIYKSTISKVNGSYAYTLQGELKNEEKSLSSALLAIDFKDHKNNTLFSRTLPLLKKGEIREAGEPLLIDSFFYLNYLPPDIEKINLWLKHSESGDDKKIIEKPLELEWKIPRPEGIRFDAEIRELQMIEGYGGNYIRGSIKISNKGDRVENLKVTLNWIDGEDQILHSLEERLIDKENPPLDEGKTRFFPIYTTLPVHIDEEEISLTIEEIS